MLRQAAVAAEHDETRQKILLANLPQDGLEASSRPAALSGAKV
jgi:hypothetical protein